MNVIKSPQDKIESYLYNEINIELYEDFSIHFKTEPKLLQFLNNLFIEFEFFSNNVNNWIEITNHFIFLETGYLFWTDEIHFNYKTEPEKLFELFNLYDGLTMLIQFHFPENKRTGAQIKTCEYIIKLGEKIQKLYLPELQKEVPIKTEPETIVINDASKTKKVKDYKDFIWFKTGLKLATGEAYELYNKYKLDKGHFTKICSELGFKESDRPYFSETINNNETDKNTFANKDKLQKLHMHLIENNLAFGVEFLTKYNQIEAE